jgi:hypothetical protein
MNMNSGLALELSRSKVALILYGINKHDGTCRCVVRACWRYSPCCCWATLMI